MNATLNTLGRPSPGCTERSRRSTLRHKHPSNSLHDNDKEPNPYLFTDLGPAWPGSDRNHLSLREEDPTKVKGAHLVGGLPI